MGQPVTNPTTTPTPTPTPASNPPASNPPAAAGNTTENTENAARTVTGQQQQQPAAELSYYGKVKKYAGEHKLICGFGAAALIAAIGLGVTAYTGHLGQAIAKIKGLSN